MRDLRGHVLLLAILVLVGLMVAPARAAGCQPPPPSAWFVEAVTVEPVELPAGVSAQGDGKALALTNTTDTELYVLGRPKPALQPYERLGVEAPKGLVPVYRLLPGRIFEWEGPKSRWAAGARGPRLRVHLGFAPPDEDRLQAFTLDLQTANRVGDQRPADVSLPPPQRSQLHLVYGRQVLAVPFTLSYALNPDYDPVSVARGQELCDPQKPLLRICLLVTGVIVLAILVIMITYSQGLRRTRKRSD